MLNIGKAIYGLLSSNTDITDIVGNNIFPNMIPDLDPNSEEVIDYPCIVYTRADIRPIYTKQKGSCGIVDEVDVIIEVFSADYTEGIDLATYIRSTLEGYKGTTSGIFIGDCILDSAAEFYDEPFVQVLKFSFRNN